MFVSATDVCALLGTSVASFPRARLVRLAMFSGRLPGSRAGPFPVTLTLSSTRAWAGIAIAVIVISIAIIALILNGLLT